MSANTRRQPTSDSDRPSESGQAAPSPDGTPEAAAGATAATDKTGRSARRFWSARRIPAALVALLSAAAIGLLLYDVVSVRAGRSAMRWRRRLAEELATRPLDDVWMIVGAALAMALGLWLFLLAVTPGLRRLLPMRQPAGIPRTEEVRADLDATLGEAVTFLGLARPPTLTVRVRRPKKD